LAPIQIADLNLTSCITAVAVAVVVVDWVLHKAGVSRNLLESLRARNLMYFGHITRKKKSESSEKQIMQGTTSGSLTRGRLKTTWMDNIVQWTGYTLDKTLMYSEDRVKWWLVHSVAKPWNEDG